MVIFRLFKNRNYRRSKIEGQSIVEVILGVLVVTLVLTAVAAGMSQSVKNTAESKFRNLATNYAQAGMEMFQTQRNLLGWDRFYEATGPGTYCLNVLVFSSEGYSNLPSGECAEDKIIAGTSFTREANVTVPAADSIKVEIVVTWDDSGQTRQVSIAQDFRQY